MSEARSARVDAIDLARGMALLGMMLVHLGPAWTGNDPPWGDVVAGGRAAPLFAMLAGVSLSLVQRRDPQGAGSVRATAVRAVFLLVLGLALGSLSDLPVLVILAFYGLMIAMALPLRRLSTTTLLALGVVWAVVAPVALLWLQIEHGVKYTEQAAASDLLPPWELLTELTVWGAYPAGVWFAYVLIGLAVGRLDLTQTRVAAGLLGTGAALVVVTLAAGWFAIGQGWFDPGYPEGWRLLFVSSGQVVDSAGWDELWLVGEHTSRPLNVLSAIGSALFAIGVCALLARVAGLRQVLTPLRAAGAMTLSLYTMHVLWTWRAKADVMAGLSSGADWGSHERWAVQVVVLLGFAVLWQRWLGRGPLERVVRWLSITVWRTSPQPERGHEKTPRS